MAIVRALAVLQVEHVGQTFFGVVFGANVLFLVWTIGAGPLTGVVYPSYEVIVISFFAYPGQIGGEGAALHVAAFTDRVATQAAASLK